MLLARMTADIKGSDRAGKWMVIHGGSNFFLNTIFVLLVLSKA